MLKSLTTGEWLNKLWCVYKMEYYVVIKNDILGASLVAQWLRVCLPMQATQVRALVWEDPTCRGATKPMRHNY